MRDHASHRRRKARFWWKRQDRYRNDKTTPKIIPVPNHDGAIFVVAETSDDPSSSVSSSASAVLLLLDSPPSAVSSSIHFLSHKVSLDVGVVVFYPNRGKIDFFIRIFRARIGKVRDKGLGGMHFNIRIFPRGIIGVDIIAIFQQKANSRGSQLGRIGTGIRGAYANGIVDDVGFIARNVTCSRSLLPQFAPTVFSSARRSSHSTVRSTLNLNSSR